MCDQRAQPAHTLRASCDLRESYSRVSRHGPPLHPRAVPLRHRPARHAPRHEGIVWGIATGCMVPTRRQDSTHAIHGTLILIAMAPSNFSMPIHLVSLATLAGHHRELSHDPLASAHGTGIFHFASAVLITIIIMASLPIQLAVARSRISTRPSESAFVQAMRYAMASPPCKTGRTALGGTRRQGRRRRTSRASAPTLRCSTPQTVRAVLPGRPPHRHGRHRRRRRHHRHRRLLTSLHPHRHRR